METCSGCKPRQPLGGSICHMISESNGKGGKHRSKGIFRMPLEHIPSYKEVMEVHICASSLCVSKLDHIASHCNFSSLSQGESRTPEPQKWGAPYFSKDVRPFPRWRWPWKSLKNNEFLLLFGFLVSWYCYQGQAVEIGWQHKDKNNTDFIVPLRTVIALWVDQVSCKKFPGLSKK